MRSQSIKSKVMKRAWEMAREGVKKFGGKVREYFSISLKMAWAEVKMASKKSVEEKLLDAGYKAWEKGGHKRIYINDIFSYLTITVNPDDDDDFLINAISLWDNTTRKKTFNLWKRQLEDKNAEWVKYEIPLYYDCISKKWVSEGIKRGEDSLKSLILESIIKKIESGEVCKQKEEEPKRTKVSRVELSKDDPDYYSATGQGHELGEFKAGMPRLVWIK